MPVLNNVKHERFANHIAAGMTQSEAYKAAGFRSKYPDSAACKLAGKDQIKARIEELTGRISKATIRRVAERVAITQEMIISELWENAQEGRKVKGGSAVTNRALELIGKHLGMFQEVQEKPPMTLEELSKQPPEVLAAMLAEAEASEKGREAAALEAGKMPAPPKVN
jgi:hypothetical protein